MGEPVKNRTDYDSTPTVNDDATKGFNEGDRWVVGSTGAVYVLRNTQPGAAAWVLVGGGGAPEGTAVLSTGEGGGTKFLREDGDNTCSWQTVPGSGAPEGTEVLSTGETGGTKFLREDGDNTSSWQTVPVGSHTVASHSDTTATGAELETLTDGSNADALHVHTASGVSDFDTEVGNNASVSANTSKVSADGSVATHSDVSGTTGTGSTVVLDTSPTIVTPVIASFATAGHDHSDAANGGALGTGSVALTALANIADQTILGHNSGPGAPIALTASQARGVLNVADGADVSTISLTGAESPTNKDLTSETNKLRDHFGTSMEAPVAGDRIPLYMNERAITILGVSFASEGGTSVVVSVEYATTIASGTVIHGDTCATSTPEWDVTPSGDATVATNQIICLEIGTVTGTVNMLHITVYYDED